MTRSRSYFQIIMISLFIITLTVYWRNTSVLIEHDSNYSSHLSRKTERSQATIRLHPQCGNGKWQKKYAIFHERMMMRPLEQQKITVLDAYRNGAGDRLTMVATAFLHALLSGRAFKLKWSGANLTEAVLPKGINWQYKSEDDDPKYGLVDLQDHMTMYIGYDNFEVNKIYGKGNLFDIGNDTIRTVVWRLNQGQIYKLFENPRYSAQLFAMGLRPETAFGCILDFLFQPRTETVNIMQKEWSEALGVSEPYKLIETGTIHAVLANSTRPLLIGLQIRFGDGIISDQSKCRNAFETDAWVKKFFSCADDLQADLERPVKLVLLTDCEALHLKAKEKYGDRIITRTDFASFPTGHIETTHSADNLRYVFSELYLFSYTDFQILSSESSFGKAAALMGLKWHQIFSFSNWNKEKDLKMKCNRANYLQWREYSTQWVRV